MSSPRAWSKETLREEIIVINQEALATNPLEVKMSPSILKALSVDAEVAEKEELASQFLARRGKSSSSLYKIICSGSKFSDTRVQ